VSLPAGAFVNAGAGVKTNLLLSTKGQPTERVWYYDLSGVKVGKKSPLTIAHFEELFRLPPDRTDSEHSWTVDRQAIDEKGREVAEAVAALRNLSRPASS
jgi:type I restriction enzyme M protein